MSTAEYHNIFVCPGCGQGLKAGERGFQCSGCAREYLCESGIPLFFYPNEWDAAKEDVTGAVKSFYEETPFRIMMIRILYGGSKKRPRRVFSPAFWMNRSRLRPKCLKPAAERDS
jgi:hypothetical protein